MTSIRRHLLVWLISGVLVAAALAGGASYVKAREEVNELFDYQLRQLAHSFRAPSFSQTRIPKALKHVEDEDDFVVQVWDKNGALIFTSSFNGELPQLKARGFGSFSWKNETWRGYLIIDEDRLIQAAQAMNARQEMSADMALRNVLPTLLLIPFLIGLIWFAVRRGLQPLDKITAAISMRSPAAMDALPEDNLPREVKPMVTALNHLLGKLGLALETQRQFVADAAHELRTPLAALQLQAEILKRKLDGDERTTALAELASGLDRMSHLISQLLAMARLEPDAVQESFATVDLNVLAKKAIVDHSNMSEAARIDLGLTYDQPSSIQGNADQLRILFDNLLANAIHHTPAGGKIDVRIWRYEGATITEIIDTGAGIQPEERERVFDRFYRSIDNDKPGSGLGLAIVKRIVDLHHAVIALNEGEHGRGLRVTICFPRP